MLTGMMVIVLLSVIGGAVDYARWLDAKTTTRAAIDASVLAGARMLQINNQAIDEAVDAAQNYYTANTEGRLDLAVDTIAFKVVDNATAVTADGEATLNTLVLKLIGIDQMPLLKLSGAEFAKAVLSVGANAEQSLEISLMLDVTGSMDGEKLESMKAAAKDLVDITVWQGGGQHTSRVALVPFATSVKLSNDLYSSVINDEFEGNDGDAKVFPLGSGWQTTWFQAERCVSERSGADAHTDKKPNNNNRRFNGTFSLDGNCRPNSNQIVPLTSDKAFLKSQIDQFVADGGTAGHIGTAWAWYMLSPRWKDYLPSASSPASYGKLNQTNSDGKPLLQKIAVLMTDGEFNAEYCSNGIRASRPGKESFTGDCEPMNGRSAEQARTLCANMKAEGITIYSVGFQLQADGEAEETMNICATSDDHVYQAQNGTQLQQSFRDIALKISDLHLSK
ncbi:MAG: pilus assembly protein TadG-related protein [Pseudomonadota bacterium]